MNNIIVKTKKHINKWNIYQKERFPILEYFPLIAAFSFCAVSYSSMLRGGVLSLRAFFTAFITSISFFMLLRIADEFKDFDEDVKYRSYRPVPRGVIKLKELGTAGVILLLVQFLTAFFYNLNLLLILIIVWFYFSIMTKEFFIKNWLKKRPIVYLWSHMLIMPLIDFYATACDWLPAKETIHSIWPLLWFIIASFFNGAVIEIGRKIRTKEDEEEGVETYTVLWGDKGAVFWWIFAMGLTFIAVIGASVIIKFIILPLIVLTVVFTTAAINGIKFIKDPSRKNAKKFEIISAIWTISIYLSIGLMPLIFKIIK